MDCRIKVFKDRAPVIVNEECTSCDGTGEDEDGEKCMSCDGSGTRSYWE